MIKVVVFGNGNMAWHLCNVFKNNQTVEVIQHYHYQKRNSSFEGFKIPFINDLHKLQKADFYLLAISDDVVKKFSSQLPLLEGIVMHTSGALSIDQLHPKNRNGVFYPLQTLSKGKEVDFSQIPICIEASNERDLQAIKELASAISQTYEEITSEKRSALHLAAVYVNNFVNHLYQEAYQICEEHQVNTSLLDSLIIETAQKVIQTSPEEAQTGPAKRGDYQTIKKHLSMLSQSQKKIYKTLSESLLKKYGREEL
ncbi:Rossmann-like and DUF2520 domain-containing protein [Ascidiimonas sp. W6]|uniref:Rossmann-like and DUF2520 domain-containing protein n=1 Tax=Ascidiimonas meishanensis TaxID=3128903 RepID=UPI0030ED38FE